MFNKIKSFRGALIALCLMLALALVFAGFARPCYASGEDGASSSDDVGDSVTDGGDDGMTLTSSDKGEDDADGEILTTGAEDTLTTGAEDEEEAEEAAWEKNVKLYTIIAAALATAVVLAVYFAFRSKERKFTTRRLVESALMVAIATILSIIKIDSPFGGGVTIVSMLPIVLLSHRWDWHWGIVTAFVYSIIQLMLGLDNVAYATSIPMAIGIILLDYVVAYSVIGLSGACGKSRSAVAIGIAVTFTLRFLCHLVTGAIIWGVWMPDEFWGLPMSNPWIYSAMYNGWYMAIELVATEIVAMLIYKPLEKYIRNADGK